MPRCSPRPRHVTTLAALTTLLAPALALGTQSGAVAAPDKAVTASNTTLMTIPDRGAADPFPSSIIIAPNRGVVSDVDVTLSGLDHTCMTDLIVLLVGPTGRRATLTYGAGSWGPQPEPVTLTFDDEAQDHLPVAETIESGTYKPTDNPSLENPSLQPADPADLSLFDGTQASGTWSLYVIDKSIADSGTLAGWSLDIDYRDAVAPAGAVSVAGTAATTSSPTTALTLDATDPSPGTGVTQMRFSNDGTTWSPFRSYAPSASWRLTPGDGTKTVYAQFADDFANLSSVATDTIVLDTRAPKAKKLTPRNKTAHVPAKTTVSFVASESLDPATVSEKTVKLTTGGKKVKAKVSYSTAKKKVALKPTTPLAAGTKYTVRVSRLVTDLAGNGFANTDWSFRTT